MFNPDMGPVNMLLQSIGIENPPRWAASTNWSMPVVILASIWRNVGYYMIIYLAGLQEFPENYMKRQKWMVRQDGRVFEE